MIFRYMLMDHFGGLYVDLDVECWQSVEASLGNASIVLQGSGYEGLTNAVMARCILRRHSKLASCRVQRLLMRSCAQCTQPAPLEADLEAV